MNTAQFREEARNQEKALNWQAAADLWAKAIAAYPREGGQLAKRDLAKMEEKRRACEGMTAQ